MKYSLLFLFTTISIIAISQSSIGQWNDYLSYQSVNHIEEGNDIMFAANQSSIFSYSKLDHSIDRYSSINGLSDKNITSISWNQPLNTLVIGYENGNVDFLSNGGVYNFSDIKRSSITGDKSVNTVFMDGENAWLGCGFGIVKIDIASREVIETDIIGFAGTELFVNSILIHNNTIYAATEVGLMEADINSALQDFNNWNLSSGLPIGNYKGVYRFGDRVATSLLVDENTTVMYEKTESNWQEFPYSYDNISDIVVGNQAIAYLQHNYISIRTLSHDHIGDYSNYQFADNESMVAVFLDNNDKLWIGDRNWGLVEYLDGGQYQSIKPDSPYSNKAWSCDTYEDNVWISHGAFNHSFTSVFSNNYFSGFSNGNWSTYGSNQYLLNNGVYDIVDVAINPNNPSQVYFASWFGGLVEKKPDGSLVVYRDNLGNSPVHDSGPGNGVYRIGGLAFDSHGNLWMTNSNPVEQIIVKKANGDWLNFGCGNLPNTIKIGNIIVTENNQAWVINHEASDGGLFLYDFKETLDDSSDDQCMKINTNDNNGALPTNNILCVAEDLDGEIWIGTADGPAIIYSPEFMFESDPPQAQQIKIEQDGNVELVLATESITTIAVDGANRKWLGTQSSGAFLLSEDGTETILHFTKDNSPLLSDQIKHISINDKTGEVFFSTTDGLMSYTSDATLGSRQNECYSVFPNPVRPEYTGPISIDGLARDSDVKITDIAGNIVFNTTSKGGRAVWNGTNFSGERVQSGVYLALITSIENDIETSCVAKILFIN